MGCPAFEANGTHVPVTVLAADNLQVVDVRTMDRDGYTAAQLGTGAAKAKTCPKQMKGHFAKVHVKPKKKLKVSSEFLEDCLLWSVPNYL